MLLITLLNLHAQRIQTIAPRQSVIVGSAFQVQYIISTPEDLLNIISPVSDSIRIVSGPHHHRATVTTDAGTRLIDNITFTLVPLKTGKVKINGLSVIFKQDRVEKAPDVFINVTQPDKASFTSRSAFTDVSLYAPPVEADVQQLIRDNIFIKTDVSRKTCFTGEPVIVTFTLFSRLESTSEVINSPSLYGFGVMDLLNINEAHISVATINGKIFNTSILRKLALYPESSGSLVIDPMQLKSVIEFNDPINSKNKIHREVDLASPEVTISVKKLPKDQPESFSGGVGNFRLNTKLSDSVIEQGKQVHMVVEIEGRGNFFQLGTPVVHWPDSFETFEPEINDRLVQNNVPAEGVRSCLFRFIAGRTGSYVIPRVVFSYFDPSAKRYFTLQSKRLSLKVIPAEKSAPEIIQNKKNKHLSPWIWIILLLILCGFLIVFIPKYRKQAVVLKQPEKNSLLTSLESINSTELTVQQLCTVLQKILSEASRQYPQRSLKFNDEIQAIRNDCQLHAYSSVSSELHKEGLKQTTTELVKKIIGHSAYL
ncbi:MAG: hypothetical protein ACJ75F_12060 [Flavisolibacter sp.]